MAYLLSRVRFHAYSSYQKAGSYLELEIKQGNKSFTAFIDQYKPFICTYSSIMSYFFLSQLSMTKDTLKDFGSSYCSDLDKVETAKLKLISDLASIST